MGRQELEAKLKTKKPGQLVWAERNIYATKSKAGKIRFGISYLWGKKREQRMIGSLARARKELAKVHADIERGEYEPKQKAPMLHDYLDDYLEYAKDNQKTTIDLDQMAVKRFKKRLGNVPINRITARDIQKYKSKRQRDHVKNTRRTLSARAVNADLKLIRRMLNLAVKHWRYLRVNPANDVELLPEPQKPLRILEPHEEQRLLSELPAHIKRLFLFGLHTGLRSRSEILTLRWDCVDMRRRVVTVEKSKTRKVRTVPLNDVAYGVLKEIRAGKNVHIERVFVYNGKPIERFNKSWNEAVRRAGVSHITFYNATRHTFGTRLARKGVPLNEIKDLMGHASIMTTQRYLHSNEARGKIAVDKLVE